MEVRIISFTWRTIHVEFPETLVPLYDKMSEVFNTILSDPSLRAGVVSVDPTLRRDNYRNKMRHVIGDEVRDMLGPDFPNKAWHSRIIFEQLRRMVVSLRERQIVFDTLNGGQADSLFWSQIHERGVYPTMGTVSNVQRSSRRPALPCHAVFVLDYSVSNPDMFTQHGHTFRAKTIDNEWTKFSVILPLSIRDGATGRVAKPRFYKNKDGKYLGDLSYEVEVQPFKGTDSVVGVDLGKVKPFSATVLHPDGTTSPEHIASRRIERIGRVVDNLYRQKKAIRVKCDRCVPYTRVESVAKDARRRKTMDNLSAKITRLKMERARLIAKSIVHIAVTHQCSEIHVENLSWLGSKGGHWEHSLIQQCIAQAAELRGITVVKVNPAHTSRKHPITNEMGTWCGRDVVFDGERLDRDHMASINIAKRGEKARKVTHVCKRPLIRTKPPSRKELKRRMRELLQARGDQIVSLSPMTPGAACAPYERWSAVSVDASTMNMKHSVAFDQKIIVQRCQIHLF